MRTEPSPLRSCRIPIPLGRVGTPTLCRSRTSWPLGPRVGVARWGRSLFVTAESLQRGTTVPPLASRTARSSGRPMIGRTAASVRNIASAPSTPSKTVSFRPLGSGRRAPGTFYVTCQPCNTCAKMIINAGIERVIYEGEYPDDFALELFRESGVQVRRFLNGEIE